MGTKAQALVLRGVCPAVGHNVISAGVMMKKVLTQFICSVVLLPSLYLGTYKLERDSNIYLNLYQIVASLFT